MYRVTEDVSSSYITPWGVSVMLTLRVNIESLLPSNRMSPNNRMLRQNRVPSSNTPLTHTTINLLKTRMNSLQPMQPLLKLRRQPTIRQSHVSEKRIPSTRRSVQDIQEGGARGLFLERDVGVPGDGVGAGGQEL